MRTLKRIDIKAASSVKSLMIQLGRMTLPAGDVTVEAQGIRQEYGYNEQHLRIMNSIVDAPNDGKVGMGRATAFHYNLIKKWASDNVTITGINTESWMGKWYNAKVDGASALLSEQEKHSLHNGLVDMVDAALVPDMHRLQVRTVNVLSQRMA